MADSVSVWNSQPHLWQWWLSSVIDEEAVALLTLSASSSGRLCNGTVSVRLSAYRSVCLSRRSTAAATCSSFAAAGAGGTYQSTYASAAYRLSIDILSAARVRGSKRAGSVLLWSKRRGDKKKVKVAYTRSRSWSRFLAVSLQVTWIINPAVGCHYFPPDPQLPSLPISLLGEQRHYGCEQFA